MRSRYTIDTADGEYVIEDLDDGWHFSPASYEGDSGLFSTGFRDAERCEVAAYLWAVQSVAEGEAEARRNVALWADEPIVVVSARGDE